MHPTHPNPKCPVIRVGLLCRVLFSYLDYDEHNTMAEQLFFICVSSLLFDFEDKLAVEDDVICGYTC